MYHLDDAEWEDYVITSATKGETHYDIGLREPHKDTGCMGFGLSIKECDQVAVIPRAGDAIRLCGSFGRPIRGVMVMGRLIYYRTPAEEQARHEQWVADERAKRRREFEETGRAELDAKYAALPSVFQARIDKFRHNNPDFRWEYEQYEMFCCEEAVKLARHFGTIEAAEHYAALAQSETFTADVKRWTSEWEEQKAIDKAAGLADGHSGNTHGMAVALAFWYLKHPENVERMHGALAPLVGSFAYGCVPPDKV